MSHIECYRFKARSFGSKFNSTFEMIFSTRFCSVEESFEELGGIELPPKGKLVKSFLGRSLKILI